MMPIADNLYLLPVHELTQDIVIAIGRHRTVDRNSPEVFDVFYVIWQSIVFADLSGNPSTIEEHIDAVLEAHNTEFYERDDFFKGVIGKGDPEAVSYYYDLSRSWAIEFYHLMRMYNLLKIGDGWTIELPYTLLSLTNDTLVFSDYTDYYTCST